MFLFIRLLLAHFLGDFPFQFDKIYKLKLTGFKGKIIWDRSKPNGQPRRCLDTTRAEKEFGFKAKTTFEEGLKNTVEWYENRKHTDY